jgi:hypothetical protein
MQFTVFNTLSNRVFPDKGGEYPRNCGSPDHGERNHEIYSPFWDFGFIRNDASIERTNTAITNTARAYGLQAVRAS